MFYQQRCYGWPTVPDGRIRLTLGSSEESAKTGGGTNSGSGGTNGGGATTTIVLQPPKTALLRLLAVVGWAGLVICIGVLLAQWRAQQDYFNTDKGLQERFHSRQEKARDKLAIIRVSGVISESDGFVKRQIDRIRQDEHVKAVVLRVDSPGGTVSASHYLYHHLRKLKEEKKIPLVVSMGSMAASGGYYISMAVGDQERSIFAESTTWTGSIGVLIPHYDISGLLTKHGIVDDTVATHPRKLTMSMTRKMEPDDRQRLQAFVDESLDGFKNVIKEGRPFFKKEEEALDELATGEIFSAQQAKGHGLIDEIGFIEEAIERAIELAPQLKKDNVRVVEYKRPATIMDGIIGVKQPGAASLDLSALLDLTAPRAYYLATWLPAVVRSEGWSE